MAKTGTGRDSKLRPDLQTLFNPNALAKASVEIINADFSEIEARVMATMLRDYVTTLRRIARSDLHDYATLHPQSCSKAARDVLKKYGCE